MKKKQTKILVTLGPASLNKKFLKSCLNSNVSLLRLNMSHINLKDLEKNIRFIRKFNDKTKICIDTEGAQIRTKNKSNKKKFFKKNQIFYFYKDETKLSLYPPEIFNKVKKNDILLIGFENLRAKILKIKKEKLILRVLDSGFIEKNKGVHLQNRDLKLNFLTKKDVQAIKIGKKNKIENYALSFTSSANDINEFKKILPTENKIYKLETKKALQNLKKIIKSGSRFLIDRGDLSKEVKIENIPAFQRKIVKEVKKLRNKEVYIATNLLESMIKNIYPTRAEANDIFNCLEMGANGLVLAAETAVGNYPQDAVNFLNKIITNFKKFKNN